MKLLGLMLPLVLQLFRLSRLLFIIIGFESSKFNPFLHMLKGPVLAKGITGFS